MFIFQTHKIIIKQFPFFLYTLGVNNKILKIIIITFLFTAKLYAHNETTMLRQIYKYQLSDIWLDYEKAVDLNSKKIMLLELKKTIYEHCISTPVTQLKQQQEAIIAELQNSVSELETILNQTQVDKKNQRDVELRLQSQIFEYLEFEKTISDFKSEQLWKITRTILIVMIVFILITIFMTFTYNNAKQKTKRQKAFNNQIIKVQEEERRRLGRELHDTVTQDIRTSLLFVRNLKEIKANNNANEKELLEKIEKLETQNLINIRNIIQNLTPPEIETANLHKLLAEYCNNTTQLTKLKCTFYAEQGLNFDSFNNFQKLNIFRIVQEAITNAVKHADCSEINILVRSKNGNPSSFVFFISDDGHGFNQKDQESKDNEDVIKQSTHLGLQGMKTRAQLMDAELNIFTDEDCGTEIRLEVQTI